ncbi:hypothetical protein [Streptomyces sp. CRN 30]|uniref:hypothetical protein n=1 Tax=Streptomyces sp. CRN 30 TaxID=3075613 RepID=UPI002A8244AE|nr:hypothetical protein [Streptomyces sp. CRN 30]
MREETRGGVGCLLAGAGAVAAVLAWAPLAADNVTGGFEGQHRDLSVLWVDLPLVLLGGALLPVLVWGALLRTAGRPWIALLGAVASLALGVWGLTAWWTPYQRPEFME